MIQEKDFLYRVPVKNALVTAPGKQVRNPEILVDLEGGEFMHGNILDANSTNKLIDQSVKDAIDNSIAKLNQAITEKADASALANEVSRATGAENDLRTAFITQQNADAKYALANSLNTVNDSVSSLRVDLSKKQDKITVNSVDVTDIETANITKLRTIVTNLIDALNTSGLIRTNSNLE